MSDSADKDFCIPETQETYCESANESCKDRIIGETPNTSLSESQDFRLVDSEADESVTHTTKLTQDREANQKSSKQSNSQHISDVSQSVGDKIISDKEENTGDETMIENEAVKNTKDDVCDTEKKDEISDEDDEIIQGTPPHDYSPSLRIANNIEIMSLKRKGIFSDDPPAKISRTISMSNVEKQLEDESRQSCESDDSYRDLLRNVDKNVIIEETQDQNNLNFAHDSLQKPFDSTTKSIDEDKTERHHSEQTNQQEGKVPAEKCCDVEKDENLNVSAKQTDVSANDSIIVNARSINESDSQIEDINLSVGTRENVVPKSSTVESTSNEKSEIETLNVTDKSVKTTDVEATLEHNESDQTERANYVEPEKIDNDEEKVSSSQAKSRISIELIYDGTNENNGDDEDKSKLEVVQIDEDEGEKSVLDSSAEVIYDGKKAKPKPEVVEIVDVSREDSDKRVLDSSGVSSRIPIADKSNYESKSCTDLSMRSAESMKESSLDSSKPRLMNGSTESKRDDSDTTLNVDSDTFSSFDTLNVMSRGKSELKKYDSGKGNSLASKDMDNIELISISDNEISNVDEKNKSDLISTSAKIVQVEREIGMFVKLKCLLHVDENTKEPMSKEVTTVHCEPVIMEPFPAAGRQKEDSQSSLADISDNKESSPGSVNSNPQLYQLNPSRLSIMSSISSSSSASSAASLAAKLALKNVTHFSIPLGLPKHAKKLSVQDVSSTLMADKQALDETYEQVIRDWRNHRLLVATVLNCANAELSGAANVATMADVYVNVSNERLDDHHHLQKASNLHSSTPEVAATDPKVGSILGTPRNKKGKALKRPRSKLTKSSHQINDENGSDDIINNELHISVTETEHAPSSRKKSKTAESTEHKLLMDDANVLANSSPRNAPIDELIGKRVFAKWSDNNFYPGTVCDRLKTKYKVNFDDGKSKTLIPEFVIPIPKILREGLSVYATTKINDYGSCGIIIDVDIDKNNRSDDDGDDNAYYTVETDDGERLRVKIQDISLSVDQAQVLKEEMESEQKGSLPSTPKALGQVTLDNMVDGKRRSKRIGTTPIFSTPKSRGGNAVGIESPSSKTKTEPSVSGVSSKTRKRLALSENDGLSSDSNVELHDEDILFLRGLQKEIVGTSCDIVKGPQSRIKGKSRSKKKVEDEQTIATLGPIPPANCNIFEGMSFILTCVSKDTLDRYRDVKTVASGTETETDAETENEWLSRPFDRERLHTQIITGGGKIYEDFDKIPKDEYKNTKLITNVPNSTAKNILCLSAGIPACNHKWIIRCCLEGKIVNVAENALSMGWSLQKHSYVEPFQASNNKPLSKTVVIIPNLTYDGAFATFWRQVCENAGAVVLIAENAEAIETMGLDSDVVVVSNKRCPSWAVNKAGQLRIPMLSTAWVIQCLIQGKLCPYNQHPCYKY